MKTQHSSDDLTLDNNLNKQYLGDDLSRE